MYIIVLRYIILCILQTTLFKCNPPLPTSISISTHTPTLIFIPPVPPGVTHFWALHYHPRCLQRSPSRKVRSPFSSTFPGLHPHRLHVLPPATPASVHSFTPFLTSTPGPPLRCPRFYTSRRTRATPELETGSLLRRAVPSVVSSSGSPESEVAAGDRQSTPG